MTKVFSVILLRGWVLMLLITIAGDRIKDLFNIEGGSWVDAVFLGMSSEAMLFGNTFAAGFLFSFIWLYMANTYEGVWVFNHINQVTMLVIASVVVFA